VNNVSVGLGALFGALGSALALPWLQRLFRSRARQTLALEATFDQSPNGMLVADSLTLKVIAANPALQRSLGYSASELREMTLPQLFNSESESTDELIMRLRDPNPRQPARIQQRCKNGNLTNIEISGHGIQMGGRRVLAFTTYDVSVRSKFEAQLLEKQQHLDHLAHHDQLTGLPNRLFLAAHLPGAIEEAKRTRSMMAVLFLDLDRFKHINDSRGHETGDHLLKAVAQRIRATVRTEDVVVRMGGDEFIVVLKSVRSSEQVNETAGRINEALSVPVPVDGRPLVTTVSIGVSLYPRDGANMGELLRHSDTAMYQAKDRGRNNFQLFSPGMDRKLKERMAIETSLRNALQRKQLDVFYQPIMDLHSNRVVGLESLLRWKLPGQGYLSPEKFIAVAEDAGLIVPIGDMVLARVFADMARWQAAGHAPVPVAVNISAVQLQRTNLPATLVKLSRQHGIRPSMLLLELTESVVFEHGENRSGESNEDAVSKLRELGVRIAIDDFGTGYSSLSYLKRWRVDFLKIDRSFIRDLVTDASDLAIVSAIIAMALHLNIKVVAEGVEGWQQLEKLRQLGWDLGQGFLFAKPVPQDQCERYLSGEPLDLAKEQERQSADFGATTGNLRVANT